MLTTDLRWNWIWSKVDLAASISSTTAHNSSAAKHKNFIKLDMFLANTFLAKMTNMFFDNDKYISRSMKKIHTITNMFLDNDKYNSHTMKNTLLGNNKRFFWHWQKIFFLHNDHHLFQQFVYWHWQRCFFSTWWQICFSTMTNMFLAATFQRKVFPGRVSKLHSITLSLQSW